MQQIANIGSPIRQLMIKEPSHVGMPKSFQDLHGPLSV
jgi:hypothetical protein